MKGWPSSYWKTWKVTSTRFVPASDISAFISNAAVAKLQAPRAAPNRLCDLLGLPVWSDLKKSGTADPARTGDPQIHNLVL
jgi:hypothetical protein